MRLGTDIIMGLVVAVLLVVLITEAYAQTPQQLPTPASRTLTATTQQIISDEQTACSEVTSDELVSDCVSVIHESPTTMVLEGRLLLVLGGAQIAYSDNPFIWKAVDRFKAQGYAVETVITTGQGSQGNPHRLYIVMSK